jgi:uncharacterized protein YdeI (YjbR/CyaY-like superfamily)
VPVVLRELLLAANDSLKATWEALAPDRRRQCAEWVGGAKQAATRERRARSVASQRRSR